MPHPPDASKSDSPDTPETPWVEAYAKHAKIYPRQAHGRFTRLRTASVLILLGLYYVLPWLSYDGRQAVWFDLPGRQFHLFSLTFWPQDFFLLALLLITAALSLFFFTALAGRLWCGYACPQSVWTEMFLWIERRFEGSRAEQLKLAKAPWRGRKLWVKGGKHSVWLLFALFTGLTFVGYFSPIAELFPRFFTAQTSGWETFWIVFYSVATWGNAGFMREQVCVYMCPYARFQSAMFDKDTLIISYDETRGEPRGARGKGADQHASGLGDCVDCGLCVQVCPTAIDIRDGLQYQCLACAACIDQCNEIMDKMGYARNLIGYTTENARLGKPTRIARPRIFLYLLVLGMLFVGLIYGIGARDPVSLDVIRDRNVLYRELVDGRIENSYTLKLSNRRNQPAVYQLSIAGVPGATLVADHAGLLTLPPGGVMQTLVRVQADPARLDSATALLIFQVQSVDDPHILRQRESRFVMGTLR